MTKKHFIEIAATIKRLKDDGMDEATLRKVATELCRTFRGINPAFQSLRFLEACGF